MPDQTPARPLPVAVPAAPATIQKAARSIANPLRRPDEQRSLFGEILDWMLAPLLVLWPMSVTLTFVVAQQIANPPYDRKLAETASLLADHVEISDGRVQLLSGGEGLTLVGEAAVLHRHARGAPSLHIHALDSACYAVLAHAGK